VQGSTRPEGNPEEKKRGAIRARTQDRETITKSAGESGQTKKKTTGGRKTASKNTGGEKISGKKAKQEGGFTGGTL